MQVLISSGYFDGLEPSQACAALAAGWQERAPHVQLVQRPMSAGGQGFRDALAASGRFEIDRTGSLPTLRPVDDPTTVYVAQSDAADAAQLASALVELRCSTVRCVVIGVGGAPQVDSAQAFIGALASRDPQELPAIARARAALEGLRLIGVVDRDRALLGMQGTCFSAVEERGMDRQAAQEAEADLGEFVDQVRRVIPAARDLLTGSERRLDRQPGAGAGGGLGYAILALGGELRPGPRFVADEVRFSQAVDLADLVVVATPTFDWRVLEHSVLAEATARTAAVGKPAVVLADDVQVGRREAMSLGLSGSYAGMAPVGKSRAGRADTVAGSANDPATRLRRLAHRVAGTWSPAPV